MSGDVVVGQVAHFNLTPEASLCRGFYFLPFVLSKGWEAQMETCGQIARTVGRLPIRFTVGTGGTIRLGAQATRSVFCRAESASVADSAEWVLAQRGGEPGDLRTEPLRGLPTSQEQDNYACFRADTGVCPYDHFCHYFPRCSDVGRD